VCKLFSDLIFTYRLNFIQRETLFFIGDLGQLFASHSLAAGISVDAVHAVSIDDLS
jgi:hypothetical protein